MKLINQALVRKLTVLPKQNTLVHTYKRILFLILEKMLALKELYFETMRKKINEKIWCCSGYFEKRVMRNLTFNLLNYFNESDRRA